MYLKGIITWETFATLFESLRLSALANCSRKIPLQKNSVHCGHINNNKIGECGWWKAIIFSLIRLHRKSGDIECRRILKAYEIIMLIVISSSVNNFEGTLILSAQKLVAAA